jgi:hypothetical protein
VDSTKSSAPPAHRTTRDELLEAACCAMRLLQDRQAHTPQEMLDPRERKVLRQLRSAVRNLVGDEGL